MYNPFRKKKRTQHPRADRERLVRFLTAGHQKSERPQSGSYRRVQARRLFAVITALLLLLGLIGMWQEAFGAAVTASASYSCTLVLGNPHTG
mgnify:FL=1